MSHREDECRRPRFARLRLRSPRYWTALAIISVVVGVCGVLGVSYVAGQGWRSFDALTTVLLCIAASVAAAIVIVACERGFTRLSLTDRPCSRLARLTPAWSWRSIALFSVIMALFWLPWLIANYPGGTYWDTYYQIFQCYPENHPIAVIPYAECYDNTLTDAYLCDHHPIVDTLIYGAFGMASDALDGQLDGGRVRVRLPAGRGDHRGVHRLDRVSARALLPAGAVFLRLRVSVRHAVRIDVGVVHGEGTACSGCFTSLT